jgi:hypothetical protein
MCVKQESKEEINNVRHNENPEQVKKGSLGPLKTIPY